VKASSTCFVTIYKRLGYRHSFTYYLFSLQHLSAPQTYTRSTHLPKMLKVPSTTGASSVEADPNTTDAPTNDDDASVAFAWDRTYGASEGVARLKCKRPALFFKRSRYMDSPKSFEKGEMKLFGKPGLEKDDTIRVWTERSWFSDGSQIYHITHDRFSGYKFQDGLSHLTLASNEDLCRKDYPAAGWDRGVGKLKVSQAILCMMCGQVGAGEPMC
jgi:hypothetical protein